MTNSQLMAQLQQIHSITGAGIVYYQTDGRPKLFTEGQKPILPVLVTDFISEGNAYWQKDALWLFRLQNRDQCLGALSLTDCGENMAMLGQLAANQFSLALSGGRENMDRLGFFAGLLRNELAPADIPNLAARLHLDSNASRLIYLIETSSHYDPNVQRTVRSLYPESSHHYLVSLSDTLLALIVSPPSRDPEELLDIGETLVDMLNMEALCNARVAHSTVVADISRLPQALEEARAALEVGKIFYSDQKVSAYSSLGIGRLIYQIPQPLCRMYLREVFGADLPEIFDEDTLNLVEKFFENNLNTSEAARKLYIHRNTLIYRLDKIQKETGLDLRTFDDALTVKIALLVRTYLQYMDNEKKDRS